MVNAQQWLDKEYPNKQEVKELKLSGKELESHLIIHNFPNLEKIECRNNKDLTSIKLIDLPKLDYFHGNNCSLKKVVINKCSNITFFNVANNNLSDLSFLDDLNSQNLTVLSLHTNNFPKQDLSFINGFVNLEQLFLDNCDEDRFKKGEYNKFNGSLKPLQNLTKLELLSIGNTNIDSGLEYLPESFRKVGLNTSWWEIEYGSCYKLRQELEKASQIKGVIEKLKSEKEINSKGKEDPVWFSDYYRIAPWRQVQNLEKTTDSQGAQGWLDKNYPKDVTEEIKKRENIIFLNINGKNLEGELDLKDFVNLKKLDCSFNQLTNLNLSKCKNLTHLNCSWNELANTDFLKTISDKGKLEVLRINNNEKIKENLEFLTPFTGLITLNLENCPFFGSLEPLKDLKKLEQIFISRTHINKGLKYLPESCKKVYCDYDPQYKSVEIVSELSSFAKDRYYDVTKWRIDKANNTTISVIPLERLFIIRSNIQQFLKKWGPEQGSEISELSQLKSPEEFDRFKYLGAVERVSTATTIIGSALTLTDYPVAGGVITLVSPLIGTGASQLKAGLYDNQEKKWEEFKTDANTFLDNYNELLGILKKIKIGEWGKVNQALNDLNEKTKDFLKVYDNNLDEEIDIGELINERKRFNEELGKIEEFVEAVRNLESEIIKYKQVKTTEDEKRIKEKEEVLTNNELFRKAVNQISKTMKIDREIKERIRTEIKNKNKKDFATREIVFLLKREDKEKKQFLIISREKRNIFSDLLPKWFNEKHYLDLAEEKDEEIKIIKGYKQPFDSEEETIKEAIKEIIERIKLNEEQKEQIRKKVKDEKENKEKEELEEEKGWGKLDKELVKKIKEMVENLEININTEWDKYPEEPVASTSKNNSPAQLLDEDVYATGSTSQLATSVFRKRTISNSKENRLSQEIYELVDLQSKEELQNKIEINPNHK